MSSVSNLFSSLEKFLKAVSLLTDDRQLFEASNIPIGCYRVNSITLSEQDGPQLWVITLQQLSNVDYVGGKYSTYYSYGKKPEIRFPGGESSRSMPIHNALTANMQFKVVSTSEDQGRIHSFEPLP